MSVKRMLLIALAVSCSLLSIPVSAEPSSDLPQPLTIGKTVHGALTVGSTRGSDSRRYNCYSIEVPAGTSLVVQLRSTTFDPVLWIARGARCSSAALQDQNDNANSLTRDAELSFKARGGRYLVIARASQPDAIGAYELIVKSADPEITETDLEGMSQPSSAPNNVPDDRVALMQRQVEQRTQQIASEQAALRFAERQRREQAQAAQELAAEQQRERQAERDSGGGFMGSIFRGLTAANEIMAGEVARSEATLAATIAAAEAQAYRERLAEAEQQRAVAQREAETQERAREGLARTLADAEAVRAQQMKEAQTKGNTDRQRQLAEQSSKAQQYANEYGVQDAVRQQTAARETQQRQQNEMEQKRITEQSAQRSAEQERLLREKAALAEAETRRLAQAERLNDQRKLEEERVRPVEFKEGVVLCQQRDSSRQWRCQGPLQTTFVEFDTPAGDAALAQACGSGKSIRDLGVMGGYRAFGCGFGIHPTADDYPGNIDVPALLGVYISGRATFRCPTSTLAYCRDN